MEGRSASPLLLHSNMPGKTRHRERGGRAGLWLWGVEVTSHLMTVFWGLAQSEQVRSRGWWYLVCWVQTYGTLAKLHSVQGKEDMEEGGRVLDSTMVINGDSERLPSLGCPFGWSIAPYAYLTFGLCPHVWRQVWCSDAVLGLEWQVLGLNQDSATF